MPRTATATSGSGSTGRLLVAAGGVGFEGLPVRVRLVKAVAARLANSYRVLLPIKAPCTTAVCGGGGAVAHRLEGGGR